MRTRSVETCRIAAKECGTIDSIDFKTQPSNNAPLVRDLLRGDYMAKQENLLLVGNPGTGKTHLACALGSAGCSRGERVCFYTTTGLVTQLLEAQGGTHPATAATAVNSR